jgi:hypothetical protein
MKVNKKNKANLKRENAYGAAGDIEDCQYIKLTEWSSCTNRNLDFSQTGS